MPEALTNHMMEFFLVKILNLPKRNLAIPSRLICMMASYLQSSDWEKEGWRFRWRKTGWDFKKYFIFTKASRFTNIINEFFCSIGWKEAKKERVKDGYWRTNIYWRTNRAKKKWLKTLNEVLKIKRDQFFIWNSRRIEEVIFFHFLS